MKGNKSTLISVCDIPNQIIDCEWVIITHTLFGYDFEGDNCYKNGKKVALIKCGGSIGYKLNGRFRSLTYINQYKMPKIMVYAKNIYYLPF